MSVLFIFLYHALWCANALAIRNIREKKDSVHFKGIDDTQDSCYSSNTTIQQITQQRALALILYYSSFVFRNRFDTIWQNSRHTFLCVCVHHVYFIDAAIWKKLRRHMILTPCSFYLYGLLISCLIRKTVQLNISIRSAQEGKKIVLFVCAQNRSRRLKLLIYTIYISFIVFTWNNTKRLFARRI